MADRPATASGYRSEHMALVRATCLYVATKLGDLFGGPWERGGDGKKETWKATLRGRAREPVRQIGFILLTAQEIGGRLVVARDRPVTVR